MPCKCQILPPNDFQFRFTYYLSLAVSMTYCCNFMKKTAPAQGSYPGVLWDSLVYLLCGFSEVNCYIQSPKSMVQEGLLTQAQYNLAATPLMYTYPKTSIKVIT